MANSKSSISPRIIRLLLAGYLIVLLLMQLFSFDDFPGVIAGAGVIGVWAYIVAISLVVSELLALPALMSMKLSKKMINASTFFGGLALAFLTILEILSQFSEHSIMFGALFVLPSGLWTLFLLISLWILYFWGVSTDTKWYQKLNK